MFLRFVLVIAATVVMSACADDGSNESSRAAQSTFTSMVTTTLAEASTSSVVSTTSSTTTSVPPSTTTTTTLSPLQALTYEPVAPADFPTMITARPGDEVALLAERGGVVRVLADGEVGDVVLDISGRTTVDGERGLLGLVRHPEDDGRLFVHYTDGAGDTVVSEFSLEDLAADPDSERVLLTVDQPAANHNGGMIQFGPDGALYLGLGDGGGGGDRFGNGQNTETLLGGIVRIDIESAGGELWHHGLRNPWRFWIDGHDIWIADVGQASFEEVDIADVTQSGINYGWPIMEGAHCYQASDCDMSGLHLPLIEIPRGDGGACSITGGVVYRGSAIPELAGRYLFSDYCGGFLRSVDRQGQVTDHTGEVGVPGRVVSFGVDGSGEVYVMTTEEVLRLAAAREG